MTKASDDANRHYTASEIAVANDTDLIELLFSLGYHVKPVGRFYTTTEMDSLRIKDRRSWFRYSEGVGGDAIAFLRHFHGMSFPEAVGYLLQFNGRAGDFSVSRPIRKCRPPPQQERPAFILPPPNAGNERVRTYLRGRGIAQSVVDDFIAADLLYEDRKHRDCIFVGRDAAGKPVFAARRGTRDGFKGNVAGSDMKIAFRFPYGFEPDGIHIYESPIDMMSWFTLYGLVNAIALCGLYDTPLATYLSENPRIRRVTLCLDADGPGREAAARLAAKYGESGYAIEDRIPPSGKDWSEYLQLKSAGKKT